MTPCVSILLTATSNTRSLFILLSACIPIFSAILIEGLIKGRFLGKAIATRKDNPFFYYFTAALLVYLIMQFSLFLKDLIHAS